jgi:hypothetical protein
VEFEGIALSNLVSFRTTLLTRYPGEYLGVNLVFFIYLFPLCYFLYADIQRIDPERKGPGTDEQRSELRKSAVSNRQRASERRN